MWWKRGLCVVIGVWLTVACGPASSPLVPEGESASGVAASESATPGTPPVAVEPTASAATSAASSGVPTCAPEPPRPQAPDDWYRDRPRYVGNEQPTEAVRAWADRHPEFQELWIDRDRNGWVTVGFSGGVDERQAEIAELFPEGGVVAVLLPIDLAALRALQERVARVIGDAGAPASIGVSSSLGVVQVGFGLLTDENRALLDEFAGEPICVSGGDPDGARTGPQVDGGDGWRLLMIDGSRRGAPQAPPPGPPPTPGGVMLGTRLEIATTQAQLDALWQAFGGAVDAMVAAETVPPLVDFEREILVAGNEVESSSCPILIFGVEVIPGGLTVDRAPSDEEVMCTSDANSLTWMIAVDRNVLPPAPFTVKGPGSLWVTTDLSMPGAAVSDDATIARAGEPGATPVPQPSGFTDDPRPSAPTQPGVSPEVPALPSFPHIVEPGFASVFGLPRACTAALGPVNGFVWVPVNPQLAAGDTPDDWLVAETGGVIPVEFLLTQDPGGEPTLDVTANGRTERYVIGDVDPAC